MSKNKAVLVSSFLSQELVERKIFLIRGCKVMIDQDLANLYQVPTKALNQAIKRNIRRFPPDFMFRLTKKEKNELVTNCDQFNNLKHSSSAPYAFTDLGVAMLSSVLNSERAVMVNIEIMRTFSRIKDLLVRHKDLQIKLDELEKKYDQQFQVVFKAIKMLLDKHRDNQNKRF
jgi:hypothetical protein